MVEAQLLRKFSVGMGLQSDAIEDLKRLKAAGSKLGSIKFSACSVMFFIKRHIHFRSRAFLQNETGHLKSVVGVKEMASF